jgi:hypothetical protein
VAGSRPDGDDLAACAWQRLEALPDPRSRRGRACPLVCLVAITVCAFTAAGTTGSPRPAVDQARWPGRPGPAARPVGPDGGRYRAPDVKTIRVVPDRLGPRALARALLSPDSRPCGRPPSASVRGYRAGADRAGAAVARNAAAEAWELGLYRLTLYAFCAALEMDRRLPDDDVRPLVHQVMDAFWCHPSLAEARTWGAYLYDSDPAGTAVRPLARPFAAEGRVTRGDHAWLPGSLALSTPEARLAYLDQAPEHELAGAPETDLSALSGGRFCWRSL